MRHWQNLDTFDGAKHETQNLFVVSFCFATGSKVHSQAAQPGPAIRNVLFIMGDDHSADVLGCYGNKIVRTPNLDRLASQGTRFDRAYVNCPMCTPSRQSLITGKLPHAVGVTLLQTPLAEKQVTIAEHLKAQGFATGAVGKMHFNSDLKHGFDYRFDKPDHQKYLKEHPPQPLPAGTKVKPVWQPFKDPARIGSTPMACPSDSWTQIAKELISPTRRSSSYATTKTTASAFG